ncbi:MAG: Ig-like domain repeat protein, partial [Pseudonocardiales bacterium]|nr:Ig-like domain repeat protein [Pseudonocardiales bacterium]
MVGIRISSASGARLSRMVGIRLSRATGAWMSLVSFAVGTGLSRATGGVALTTVGEAFNAAPPARQSTTMTTTVTLTTSAVSPVAPGAPVALTATVTPIAGGTVQFKDGITNLGSPVRVTNGSASGSTSALAVGSHSLRAVFTPHNPAAYG